MQGRKRGKKKDLEELKAELKAKGLRPDQPEPLAEIETGSEPPAQQLKPLLHENYGHRERGHQKGFGKNQGKEGMDMNTGVGTRDLGAEHN
jgi:hypothetical protein